MNRSGNYYVSIEEYNILLIRLKSITNLLNDLDKAVKEEPNRDKIHKRALYFTKQRLNKEYGINHPYSISLKSDLIKFFKK